MQIYKYVKEMKGKYLQRPYGNTHLAGSSNKKTTSKCQEQTEEGGGRESEIRGSWYTKRSFDFDITVMGSLSEI